METLALVLSIVAIVIAFYYYVLRNGNMYKKHGIPYIPAQPVFGNLGSLMLGKSNITDIFTNLYNMNPEAKYVGLYEFRRQTILLRDSDLVKSITMKHFDCFSNHRTFTDGDLDPLLGNILFFLNDEHWKQARSTVTPTFTPSKMKSMFPLILSGAKDCANYLAKLPENDREIELKNMMGRCTHDLIVSCAFGIDVDSKEDPNNIIYTYCHKAANIMSKKATLKAMIYRNAPWLSKALNLRAINKDSSDFFYNMISSTVKTRDEKGITRGDMIQLLMEIRDKREPGKQLTMDEITVHAFAFFFGGYDNVSSQLSHILYNLAANPDVQDRLQREIDQVLKDTQGQVTYDALMDMEYLDAVIHETMRITPVSPFLDRLCVKRFELPPAVPGGKPFTIEPGTSLWIPVYSIQHDPKYFENPDRFDPERFVVNGKKIMGSGTFIPFGIGPRMCIGNRYALLSIKVLLFYALARCDFLTSPKAPPPMEFAKGVLGMIPKNGLWVKVAPRINHHPFLDTPGINGMCKAATE